MRFAGDCYRALDPRWSFLPLSGAARQGGRFNSRGTPALYLSIDIETAIAEASQAFPTKLEPLTLCLYTVDCTDIVDLRSKGGRRLVHVELDDMACAWLLDRDSGATPRSWQMAERLRQEGAAGILVPSFAPGAKAGSANLVLWRWEIELPHRVVVHDPSTRLPSDPLSWPR